MACEFELLVSVYLYFKITQCESFSHVPQIKSYMLLHTSTSTIILTQFSLKWYSLKIGQAGHHWILRNRTCQEQQSNVSWLPNA